MDTLLQDLRYAARSLAKSPGLTSAAVATLALGIGANSSMFGVVDRLYFRPPAHVIDPDRVVRINVTRTRAPFGTFTHSVASFPHYADFRDHARTLSDVAATSGASFSLGRGAGALPVKGALVTASFFPLLGVQPERGRFFTAEEDRPGGAHVAVLSHEFWQRQFGEAPDIIGRTLQLGRNVFTVVGVTPEGFSGVDLLTRDLWVPMSVVAPEVQWPGALECDECFWLETIGRLAPGMSVTLAATEGTAIYRAHVGGPMRTADSTATISMNSVHEALGPGEHGGARVAAWLAVVCGIVLLIACANVANLLLARAVQRRREIALRVALGASRGRLILQLYTESALLAVLGAGVALLVTLWTGPLLQATLLPDAALATALDARALVFALIIVTGTAFVAGFAPALYAGTPDLAGALKSGTREGTLPRSTTRTGLLVGQVSLTVVLLAGAGLFIRSLRHVNNLRLGFDSDRLIVASVELEELGYPTADINALYQRIRERVERIPGVEGASLSIGTPFRASWGASLSVPGVDSIPQVKDGGPYITAVTPEYFRTMGATIRRGRGFTEADWAGAQRVTVVGETLARLLWPGQNPLGKTFKIGDSDVPVEVVGVVEDARRQSIRDGEVLMYYVPLAQSDDVLPGHVSSLLVRTAGPAERLVAKVRREVQATSPDLPYPSIDPMPQLFAWQLRPWRIGSTLLSLFGGLGLLLAAVGLYGVLSYVVSQRTQEIGIRIALGADRRSLLSHVVGQGLAVTLAGLVIGLAGALVAGRAIASLLYGVSPRDPVVLVTVAVLLTLVAVVASYIPARRATRVDPMVALRCD